MILTTNTGALVPTEDNIEEFERILTELATVYSHNLWTWSGDAVTRPMIEWRLNNMIQVAVDTARQSEGYAAISGGRLRVEARDNPANSQNRYTILISVQFSV